VSVRNLRGNCPSQFNLAAMALHGQGGAKDLGSGAGWLQAAAGNGCDELVGNRLTGLTAKLSPEEARLDAYRHGKAWRGDLLASP
jgi:TPR repeat protein